MHHDPDAYDERVLASLLAFTAAAVMIVVLPGPDTLVVVRSIVRGGRAEGIRTSLGVLCGLMVWVLAAVLGVSAMLQASQVGYDVLRILGACYLVWMGVQTIRSLRREAPTEFAEPAGSSRLLTSGGFTAGFLTDLLNPKVGVLFISFLPGFVPEGYAVTTTTLGFGALYVALTAVYCAALVAASGKILTAMRTPRIRRRIDGAAGLTLIGFGVRIATER